MENNQAEFGRIRTANPKQRNYLNRVQAREGTTPCVFFTDEKATTFLGGGSEELWKEARESWSYNQEPLPKSQIGKNLQMWAEMIKEILQKGESPSGLKYETLQSIKKAKRYAKRYPVKSSGATIGEITGMVSLPLRW